MENGRIIRIHPGGGGTVCVLTVRAFTRAKVKRSVVKMCVLLTDNDSTEVENQQHFNEGGDVTVAVPVYQINLLEEAIDYRMYVSLNGVGTAPTDPQPAVLAFLIKKERRYREPELAISIMGRMLVAYSWPSLHESGCGPKNLNTEVTNANTMALYLPSQHPRILRTIK
ncbi:Hypothetical protein CINCED_3A006050 [Cinara cedri]|uniref:Uncharacterized protein n=1 Tax=Cinara cedri TaxID=506608 RepID=A0A5E4MDL1_9HEMI|nr:Hypothetical protein CINCED_3A006050 [Cinara cedri]